MLRAAAFALLILLFVPAAAQDHCASVHFPPGASSTTVKGSISPDGTACYTFSARAGQTAEISVAGNNVIVSVIGIGDARDHWTFATKAGPTRFLVGQLMRSAAPELYTVTVSIR
jgi:hypothetical protein